MNENVAPPIAYPHGKDERWRAPFPGHREWLIGTDYVAVYYSPWGKHWLRGKIKAWTVQPLTHLFYLSIYLVRLLLNGSREAFFTTYSVLLVLGIWNLWRVMNTDKEALVFDSQVLKHFKRGGAKRFFWRNPSWIVNWDGDVLFVFLWRVYFIPRETFDSSGQVLEFVELAHQLKNHQGSVWPREWKSRIYGLEPDAIEWKLIANVYKSRLM